MRASRKQRCHVVHDREGRILALAPVGAVEIRNGVQVGWRPVAGLHQFVTEIDLTPEQARVAPYELLEKFQIHIDSKKGTARLQRKAARS